MRGREKEREGKNFKKGEYRLFSSPFPSYLFCPSIQKRPLSWPKNRWQSGIRKERKGGQRKGWKSVGRKRRGSRRSAFKIMRSLLCLLLPPPSSLPPSIVLIPPNNTLRIPSRSSHFSSLLPFFPFLSSFFYFALSTTNERNHFAFCRSSTSVEARFAAPTIVIKIQLFVD